MVCVQTNLSLYHRLVMIKCRRENSRLVPVYTMLKIALSCTSVGFLALHKAGR